MDDLRIYQKKKLLIDVKIAVLLYVVFDYFCDIFVEFIQREIFME